MHSIKNPYPVVKYRFFLFNVYNPASLKLRALSFETDVTID